jgi:KDO2-lipid IV(A) lauroyltransferase
MHSFLDALGGSVQTDTSLLLILFKLLAKIPLGLMQALGMVLGLLVWLISASYRKEFGRNADLAQLDFGTRVSALMNTGAMVAELPWVWCRPKAQDILKRVVWSGESCIEEALARGQGVIILSPHLGCWEIGAQILAARFGPQFGDLVAMYRPPRKKILTPLFEHARNRAHLRTVPTSAAGVREILRTLKHGGMTALLPDQVPPLGQGVWAKFLGQEAYTMTLAMKLAHQTQSLVVMGWCERLPRGQFKGHFAPLTQVQLEDDPSQLKSTPAFITALACQAMNDAVEQMVKRHASQYLWGYARFKQPRAVNTQTHVPTADGVQ